MIDKKKYPFTVGFVNKNDSDINIVVCPDKLYISMMPLGTGTDNTVNDKLIIEKLPFTSINIDALVINCKFKNIEIKHNIPGINLHNILMQDLIQLTIESNNIMSFTGTIRIIGDGKKKKLHLCDYYIEELNCSLMRQFFELDENSMLIINVPSKMPNEHTTLSIYLRKL